MAEAITTKPVSTDPDWPFGPIMDQWFKMYPPSEEEVEKYNNFRAVAKRFGQDIIRFTPDTPSRKKMSSLLTQIVMRGGPDNARHFAVHEALAAEMTVPAGKT